MNTLEFAINMELDGERYYSQQAELKMRRTSVSGRRSGENIDIMYYLRKSIGKGDSV